MRICSRNDAVLCVMIAIVVLPSNDLFGQGGPSLVKLSPIVERTVREGQTFVGTVMPTRRATIGSAVDGRVVEYPINEGDRVSAGQTLAQLLTDTIELEVAAAEAELDLRKEELAELENGSRPEEIDQARARMEAARATSDYRESQRKRMLALYEQGRAATDQQVDEATSLALEASETYQEAKAAHQLIVAGPRIEQIAQAKARVAMQTAVAERLRDQMQKHTIVSRFDGYVVTEHTEVGQWVSQGDPVAEIVALDEVDVEAKVVEGQVPNIAVGSSVPVSVPAVSHEPFIGAVASIVPQADVRSRTFPVKVRVRNVIDEQGQPALKSGMLAQVNLATGAEQDAMLVPKDALVLGGPGSKVAIWIVDPRSATLEKGTSMLTAEAELVPVEEGVADGELIQVIGDVSPTASVVVLGNERLPPPRPGTPTMVRWVTNPDDARESGAHGSD